MGDDDDEIVTPLLAALDNVRVVFGTEAALRFKQLRDACGNGM